MPIIVIEEDYCKGCELCVSVCPKDIIILAERLTARGYRPAVVTDGQACTAYAFCARVCPEAAIEVYLE